MSGQIHIVSNMHEWLDLIYRRLESEEQSGLVLVMMLMLQVLYHAGLHPPQVPPLASSSFIFLLKYYLRFQECTFEYIQKFDSISCPTFSSEIRVTKLSSHIIHGGMDPKPTLVRKDSSEEPTLPTVEP